MAGTRREKRRVRPGPTNHFVSAAGVIAKLPWPLFLGWTALALLVLPLGWGEAQAFDWLPGGTSSGTLQVQPPSAAEQMLAAMLRAFDAAWFFFAGVSVYFALAAAEGLRTARRWGLVVVPGAALLHAIAARTGWPFGPIAYTEMLGWRIAGGAPFTLALFWLVLVAGSRSGVVAIFPRANKWALAGAAGLAGFLTHANTGSGIRATYIRLTLRPGRAALRGPFSPPRSRFCSAKAPGPRRRAGSGSVRRSSSF
jgi:hypothetical protein